MLLLQGCISLVTLQVNLSSLMMCGQVLHLGLVQNVLCFVLRRVNELLFCAWGILDGVFPMLVKEVLDWSAVLGVFLKKFKMLVWMVPCFDWRVSKSLKVL